MNVEEQEGCCHRLRYCIPTRVLIGIMLFVASFVTYMVRVNMSVIVLAMISRNNQEEYGPKYDWNLNQEALLLGGYFYGYVISSIPGGILAERFGGRIMVGIALVICAIATAAGPLSADLGFGFLFATRILLGIMGGILSPAIHILISKWAPVSEKGKFVATFMGGTLGTVVTWPGCGAIIESIGWIWSFYIPAVICAMAAVFWFRFVYNKPDEHPRITPKEVAYIEAGHLGNVQHNKVWPPVQPMLKSIPFYALLLLHIGNLWGLFFLITSAPKFVNEVLGYHLLKTGEISILPYVARLVLGFVFGFIGDHFVQKEESMKTFMRKAFTVFSHIIPGALLLLIAFLPMSNTIIIVILVLSLGLNGASTVTCLHNAQDLSPNFAGTIYGIINCVGATSGFLNPVVVAQFTAKESTIDTWSWVFMIAAIFYIVPAIIFIIFGSAEVQPWNKITNVEQTK